MKADARSGNLVRGITRHDRSKERFANSSARSNSAPEAVEINSNKNGQAVGCKAGETKRRFVETFSKGKLVSHD